MSYLARLLVVMGPAFLINEEVNFFAAMTWVLACWMILLGTSERAWIRR
jgi:hypothetical protein